MKDKKPVTEKKNKSLIATLIQFIKFGLVGLSNTLISLAVYNILVLLGMNYLLANTMGFLISTFNAYYWNSRYVFGEKDQKINKKKQGESLLKTYVSYGFTFLLSQVLLYIWVDVVGISKFLAQFPNLCITIPLNFIINKVWTFKNKNLSKGA